MIAADDDGDLVVAWGSNFQDGSEYGIFAQRFSSAGTPLGGEFQVNSSTVLGQVGAAIAADAGGDFVVVWNHSVVYEDTYTISARRFSRAGIGLATEFQVSSSTVGGFPRLPAVAADRDGDFVVAWKGIIQDLSGLSDSHPDADQRCHSHGGARADLRDPDAVDARDGGSRRGALRSVRRLLATTPRRPFVGVGGLVAG
jgi:hypothetical protein